MLVKFSLRNIRRNRRRSLAAIGTIAVGVFGLLFLQGFFAGLLSMHAHNSVHSRHGHGQITTRGYWGQTFEKPSDHWILEPQAVMQSLATHPKVLDVFPRVQFFALISNGTINVAGRGQGIVGDREQAFFDAMNFVEGGPIGGRKDGIVLGIGLARALGVKVGDNVTVIGQTLHGTINAIDAVVSGVFHVGFKEADDLLFQVQLAAAHVLLDTNKVESIAVGLKDGEAWDDVAQAVTQAHPQLEALSVNVIDQVWAENGRLFLTALLNIFRLTFLGVILLAIYNSASNTVLERQRELGMLRANGESALDLIQLLLLEGLALAVIGAAIGAGLVMLVNGVFGDGIIMPPTPGTNRELPVKLDLQAAYVATAMLLGIGTATAATFISTLQVTRLSIVRALRTPG